MPGRLQFHRLVGRLADSFRGFTTQSPKDSESDSVFPRKSPSIEYIAPSDQSEDDEDSVSPESPTFERYITDPRDVDIQITHHSSANDYRQLAIPSELSAEHKEILEDLRSVYTHLRFDIAQEEREVYFFDLLHVLLNLFLEIKNLARDLVTVFAGIEELAMSKELAAMRRIEIENALERIPAAALASDARLSNALEYYHPLYSRFLEYTVTKDIQLAASGNESEYERSDCPSPWWAVNEEDDKILRPPPEGFEVSRKVERMLRHVQDAYFDLRDTIDVPDREDWYYDYQDYLQRLHRSISCLEAYYGNMKMNSEARVEQDVREMENRFQNLLEAQENVLDQGLRDNDEVEAAFIYFVKTYDDFVRDAEDEAGTDVGQIMREMAEAGEWDSEDDV